MLRRFAYPVAKHIDSRMDKRVKEAIEILDFGEKASLEELQSFRLKALQALIHYVYESVPYYREKFSKQGIYPDQIQEIEDIEKLPVLTKDDIRTAGNLLRSTKLHEMKYIITRSGGTTGEPIASYVDRRAQALGTYAAQRGLEWMGWKPGIPVVTLFGGSLSRPIKPTLRDRLRDYSLGTVFLPAFELKKESAYEYLELISKNSPCIIKGYASALYNLALYAEEVDYRPNSIISIFSTAEYLPDQWAYKISTIFGCPVKCYYGCGEINSLGFQVEQFGPYIVPDEHVIVESIKNKLGNSEGNKSLLVTSLFNYAQPLIRYQLGDIGEVSLPGRLHPTRSTITNLIGRSSDMFVRKDGTTVSPSIAPHIISKINLPVIKYQFIQKDLRNIHFLYDPETYDLSDAEKNEVTSILRTHISDDINLRFIKTNEFVLSKNGKYRIVISEIKWQ